MMRYLNREERQAIRPLYEEAFDDTAAFVDYYLHSYVKGRSRCLVAEDAGEIVSMISIHPKQWRMRSGKSCAAWYLYGIATKKEYRRKGYMRFLMERVLADAKREEIAYVYLIPVHPEVYEALGFRLVDRGWTAKPDFFSAEDEKSGGMLENAEQGPFIWKPLTEVEKAQADFGADEDIYELLAADYTAFYEAGKTDVYIDKNAAYFREQAMRARLEQGDIYLLYEGKRRMAFATAALQDGRCIVVEYIGAEALESRLPALANMLGAGVLQYGRLPVMLYQEADAAELPQRLGSMDEV